MAEQTHEGGKRVLITLPYGIKLEGTIKDGIITVYLDADSVGYRYADKKIND